MRTSEEQALLLALCRVPGVSWPVLAREAQRRDGLDRLRRGELVEQSVEAQRTAKAIAGSAPLLVRRAWEAVAAVREAAARGAVLHTILDPDFPVLLRLTFNAAPFVFVRGDIGDSDLTAVALAGTASAREPVRSAVIAMAAALADARVTVVSGVEPGTEPGMGSASIAAAREAGGRVVGVLHCGVSNSDAALDDLDVVLSPFWPDTPVQAPSSARFLSTASGLAQATFVADTSASSPGRLQAYSAVEQGRKVLIAAMSPARDDWARRYVEERGAQFVTGAAEVLASLVSPDRIHAEDRRRAELAAQFG